MALTATNSAQLDNDVSSTTGRKYPIDDHGKVRIQYAKVTQGAAAGDDGSTVIFFDLPPGRVRVLPYMSRVKSSALGAARVLKVGNQAYSRGVGVADEILVDNSLGTGIDVSAAAVLALGTAIKFDFYSRGGVRIYGTVTGGTIPAAATLELLLAYVVE